MAESSDYTRVAVYRSETANEVPLSANLVVGELALNIVDKKIYTKNSVGDVVEVTNSNDHEHSVEDITDLVDVLIGIIEGLPKEIPIGGTEGQALVKVDGTDYNVEWADVIVDWTDIINKPASLDPFDETKYAEAVHTHTKSEITDFNDNDYVAAGQGVPTGGTANQVLAKIDGTDYNTEWQDVAASGPEGNKHRYWRIDIDTVDDLTLWWKAVDFWTGGAPYTLGQQYYEGEEIDLSGVDYSLSANNNMSESSSDVINWDNDPTSPSTSLRFIPNSNPSGETAGVDFDFNTPVIVTSFRLYGSGSFENFGEIRIYYSDDDINYTLASVFNGENVDWATLAGDASPHFVVLEDSQSTTSNNAQAFFPNTLTPIVQGGGSGVYSFDTTVKTADFTAVAGMYYFVAPSTNGSIVVDLPPGPSSGDIVGIRHITDGESSVELGFNGNNIESNASGFITPVIPSSQSVASVTPSAALVYVDAIRGWMVFQGEILFQLPSGGGGF